MQRGGDSVVTARVDADPRAVHSTSTQCAARPSRVLRGPASRPSQARLASSARHFQAAVNEEGARVVENEEHEEKLQSDRCWYSLARWCCGAVRYAEHRAKPRC